MASPPLTGSEREPLLGRSPAQLSLDFEAAGHAPWRVDQVLDWIYKKQVLDPMEMGNLPKALRGWLAERYSFLELTLRLTKQSGDDTDKLLLGGEDGSLIETVLIRAPQTGVGRQRSRNTVCVSSQVGCAYGCRFCASGLAGWKRNLNAAEILSQFFLIGQLEGARKSRRRADHLTFDNIVFMGMGEPLANYEAVLRAIRCLQSDWGFRCGARRITLSTSGLVPEIDRLAKEELPLRLAISLHGATNAVRNQIMPINRKYPLELLIPAAKRFQEIHGRMLTLEFILIEDVNDSIEQAKALVDIAREVHAHVNCIPYNRVQGLPWKRPSSHRQKRFAEVLKQAGVSVTVRKEKGHDIAAACGQLRLHHEGSLTSKGNLG